MLSSISLFSISSVGLLQYTELPMNTERQHCTELLTPITLHYAVKGHDQAEFLTEGMLL